jgi:hypothetical protein
MNAATNSSLRVILGRAFWIMFGPMLLFATGMMILLRPGSGWRTGADITFLVTLVLMILARWAEFSGGDPQKSTGGPATAADFRRFAVAVVAGGLAFYILANLLANHVLV